MTMLLILMLVGRVAGERCTLPPSYSQIAALGLDYDENGNTIWSEATRTAVYHCGRETISIAVSCPRGCEKPCAARDYAEKMWGYVDACPASR